MNQSAKVVVLFCSLALAGGASAIARADLQDHDMADRIYEKYKKRSDERERRDSAPQMRVSLDQATNMVIISRLLIVMPNNLVKKVPQPIMSYGIYKSCDQQPHILPSKYPAEKYRGCKQQDND